MEKGRDVGGNRIGNISTDFGGDRSRHNEIVRIVLPYGFVVVAGADLPVFDGKFEGKIVGRITDAPQIHEHKVGMTGEAASEAFLGCLAGFVPAVDQTGQVTDIGAGKVADIADVEGDSAFSLQGFEVAVFELLQESRKIY